MSVTVLLLLVVRMSMSTHLSKLCPKYVYGDECNKECHNCDEPCYNVTGRCMDGCSPGWMGERCHEECIIGNGETYRGNLSEVSTGSTCLYWWDTFKFNLDNNRGSDFFLDHNYCRNHRGTHLRPWCYVALGVIDYCDLPNCSTKIKECLPYRYGENCSELCYSCPEPCFKVSGLCMDGCIPGWTGDRCDKACLIDNGKNYNGNLSTTVNGYTCLSWLGYAYKNKNHELHVPKNDHNFCRTWDSIATPYCYVDKGRGVIETDQCSIDECPGNVLTSKNESLCPKYYFGQLCQYECYRCKQTCNNVTGMCPDGCSPGWAGEKCDEETNCLLDGVFWYRGTWHTTADGETCASWYTGEFKMDGASFWFDYNHNFCRNPLNGNGFWCVVNHELKSCDIPKCSEQTVTPTEGTDEPLTEYVTSYFIADYWNGATTPLPTVCTCVTIIVNIMTARVQINE